ncbi:ATP-binding cassette domain-containing protein, partial [Methylobacterium radiotolerans]|uniref:ATP-binding cassette domain-containing protein n=1 Tax=Methylobacterium radiotolerans TaxID=31998 RepID=UPI001FDA88CD
MRVEDVSKTFDTAAVLHDLSLDVRAGELIGLLGPSGSGKTTLLRIIAGLDAPDRGRILFGDADATDRKRGAWGKGVQGGVGSGGGPYMHHTKRERTDATRPPNPTPPPPPGTT